MPPTYPLVRRVGRNIEAGLKVPYRARPHRLIPACHSARALREMRVA